jgi:hypothetical protein
MSNWFDRIVTKVLIGDLSNRAFKPIVLFSIVYFGAHLIAYAVR